MNFQQSVVQLRPYGADGWRIEVAVDVGYRAT